MVSKALVGAVTTASVLYVFGFPGWSVLGFSLLGFLGLGGWRFLSAVVKTGPRDAWLATRLVSLLTSMRYNLNHGITIPDLFDRTVRAHPQKTAIICGEDRWTFQQLDNYANRVANYFAGLGLKKGDSVALFVENCPEFVGMWVGLAKIGVVSAFINYNQRQEALAHSIRVCKASAVVFSAGLGDALYVVLPDLDISLSDMCFSLGGESNIPQAKCLDGELEGVPVSPPPVLKNKSFQDQLCYIYTSGTTGLPKAVVIKHRKFYHMSWGHGLFLGITPRDVIYCTLPLYHSNGGVIAVGAMVLRGCTFVLRKKFSASNFWTDCVKHQCTVVFYIGEICRYLLAQPQRPTDTQHCVRLATGNGLRPQIWRSFQTRFKVTQIGEFYGSTEGNITVVNCTNKEGAVGNLSVILPFIYPVTLIKVNPETGEYVKDSNGFCVKAGFNEPGEIVGKIEEGSQIRQFDGYHDDKATQKKIMHNVLKPGDAYFLSGDILRMDSEGYLYFCDRTGDTFRWKGENVSTTEVESIIANALELRDVCVYGVEVAGTEGRAGMAAIAGGEGSVDLSALSLKLSTSLPSYAVPVFIRLVPRVDLTGTFKMQKNRLRSDGFDTSKVSDPLYVLDPVQKTYVPLDRARYQDLQDGTMRL